MNFLVDENLSHRLVHALKDLYNAVHVRDIGLSAASDTRIWEYGGRHDLIIVSKDSDFHQRSFLLGPPPKVVWIQRGNCPTRDVESILREHKNDLEAFHANPLTAFLMLS